MSKENTQGMAFHRIGPVGLIVGALALVVWGAMFVGADEAGRREILGSYLFGYLAFASLTLGCFGLTLLHHTVRGQWGLSLLRFFEAGGGPGALILMAVGFLPIAYGLHAYHLYEWADPAHLDDIIRSKQWWLNNNFFYARTAIYFAIWIFWATLLRRSSVGQDTTRDPVQAQRRTNWAAPGLVMYFMTTTFAFTDWIMTLQPHWFSTVWGAWLVMGSALMAMSLAVFLLLAHRAQQPFKDVIVPGLTKDHGNLLFTLTMLWTYLMLSQFLIIWSANLKEEIPYFLARSENGWNFLGLIVIVGQFFIPFFVLLAPKTKRLPALLIKVAIGIFILRFLDLYWVIMPSIRHHGGPIPTLGDILALLGVGGLWLYVFVNVHKQANPFPMHDPRIRQVVEHAS